MANAVASVLALLGLLGGIALAQGWPAASQSPPTQPAQAAPMQSAPGQSAWYTGNAGMAPAAGAPRSYADWAAATVQDVPGGWGQQPQQVQPPPPSGYGYPSNRYPAADSAELPRAVTWSRRPPPIAPPVQYAPQSRMPAAAAWDPRAAQAPLGYAAPSAGQYVGARYVGGPYAAGQYAAGQYAAGQYAAGQYAAGQYGAGQSGPASPSYQPVANQPAPFQAAAYQAAVAQRAPAQPAPAQPGPAQPAPNQSAPYPFQPAAYQAAQYAPPVGNSFSPPPLPERGPVVPPAEVAAPSPPAESVTGAKLPRNEEILAYVGPDVILMGDVLPEVEHALKQALKGKASPPEDELEKIKTNWIRGRLKSTIEIRQVLVHVRQQFKDDESKYRDIRKQMGKAFDEKHVKTLIEQHKEKGVTCRADLEARAVELFGSPLSRVKENFIDQTICYSFVNQKLPKDEEVSHADALAHYQAHQADFEFPAKARWEQITIKYGAGKHTRDEAGRLIVQCGTAILGGARFDAIARQYSEDTLSAKNGGAQDWIGQGSLVCEKIDAALFDPRLPVGQLSPAIEDGDAFHIIRVLERRAAGKTPFAEAQKEIKEKLKKERQEAKRREYMEKILEQVPFRNVFEEKNPAPPPSPPPSRPQRSDDE